MRLLRFIGLALLLGTTTAVGCGGSSGGKTDGSVDGSVDGGGSGGGGGAVGSGGSGSGGATGSGGAGGITGSGGSGVGGGYAGVPNAPGQLVNAGSYAKSTNYKMVFTLGQPSLGQSTTKSTGYRMQSGLIGAAKGSN